MATQLYQPLERIGRGSFGEVYKAVVIKTGELVAIKQLDLDNDEDDIDEIQKEITVLSRCDSPYVTKYWGSYLVSTKLWIVMDYAGGGSIRALMKAGPLNEKCIFLLALEACSALSYLHRNGIIHRDIKAANILLTDDGHVKVCDFGVAGQVTSSASRRNSFVGTPFWMAPEVIKRLQYDFKADIWSFGITVYEMANGNPPYVDQDPMKAVLLISRNHPARLEGQQYSKLLKELVETCLNDVPDNRPSADDLLKSKFFRALRPSPPTLRDLVVRHQEWMASFDHQDPDAHDQEQSPVEQETIGPWAFDTVKQVPTPQAVEMPEVGQTAHPLHKSASQSSQRSKMASQLDTIRMAKSDTPAAPPRLPDAPAEGEVEQDSTEEEDMEDDVTSQGTSTPVILDVTPNPLSYTTTPQRRPSEVEHLQPFNNAPLTQAKNQIALKTQALATSLEAMPKLPLHDLLRWQQTHDPKQIAAMIAETTDVMTDLLKQTQTHLAAIST